jgi:hypothetical protein
MYLDGLDNTPDTQEVKAMWLTFPEYQEFQQRFDCTSWPRDGAWPVEIVEVPEGDTTTAYVAGSQFGDAVQWIKLRRSQALTASDGRPAQPVTVQ